MPPNDLVTEMQTGEEEPNKKYYDQAEQMEEWLRDEAFLENPQTLDDALPDMTDDFISQLDYTTILMIAESHTDKPKEYAVSYCLVNDIEIV